MILEDRNKTILSNFSNTDDILEKGGKPAQPGERRLFNGKPFIRQPQGSKILWLPDRGNKIKKPEEQTKQRNPASNDVNTKSSSNTQDDKNNISKKPKTAEEHVKDTPTDKLQAFIAKEGTDPKLKSIAEAELKSRQEEIEANKNPFEDDGNSESSTGEGLQKKALKDVTGKNKLSVAQRVDNYHKYTQEVINGKAKSMIAFGNGGFGKSYGMQETLDKAGLKPYKPGMQPGSKDYDYVIVKGKSNTTELWKTLYEHNGKLIIYDDCDGFLDNKSSQDILKSALDGTGNGEISWKELKMGMTGEDSKQEKKKEYQPKDEMFNAALSAIKDNKSEMPVKTIQDKLGIGLHRAAYIYDELKQSGKLNEQPEEEKSTKPNNGEIIKDGFKYTPKSFVFNGAVCFITNRSAKDFQDPTKLQPLLTRALPVDLTMSKDESIELAKQRMPQLKPLDNKGQPIEGVMPEDKSKVLEFMEKNKDKMDVGSMSLRNIGSALKLMVDTRGATDQDWEARIAPIFGIKDWD